ncbi:hypothetical protein STCU_12181 [Strigomonas culicis]|uniref:Uncharacterized protein n=1 Tax=Strigomonas culicis TaxID=28005 RepID=S9UXK1_9TRYP|nr:hypothetical protein STCU_12181 [Strigomonas culicis]|eukprot:EPY15265.1 hypothetical protein STCU_12181 [Strigomonas culicis]
MSPDNAAAPLRVSHSGDAVTYSYGSSRIDAFCRGILQSSDGGGSSEAAPKRQPIMMFTEHIPSASERARGAKAESAFNRFETNKAMRRVSDSAEGPLTPQQSTRKSSAAEAASNSAPTRGARPLLAMQNAPVPGGAPRNSTTAAPAAQSRLARGGNEGGGEALWDGRTHQPGGEGGRR